MISRSLRIEAFAADQLAHLLELWDPPGRNTPAAGAAGWIDRVTGKGDDEGAALPAKNAHAALVLLRRGRAVRILLFKGGGELPPSALEEISQAGLRRMRLAHDLAFVVAVHAEALPAILAQLQRSVDLDGDPVAQGLAAMKVLARVVGRDLLISPRLVGKVPLPPFELLQRTFDKLLPDGQTVLFYIFDEGRVWASLIARKRAGDIDLLATQQALEGSLRVRSPSDLPKLRALVAQRYGEPHICLATPLSAWRRFVGGDRSALARAIATRQATLDPAPAWLKALIGAGLVSEAASRSAALAGKLLSKSPLGGLFGASSKRIVKTITNPLDALGVDPWELLRWGRSWSRRSLPLVLGQRPEEDHP